MPGRSGCLSGDGRATLPSAIPARVGFLTVTDRFYFPGTVACVNSIFHHHPDAHVVVVDHEEKGLSRKQAALLVSGGSHVWKSGKFARPGRHMGAWELKAYAASDLAGAFDLLVGIDSDCVLCASVTDKIRRSYQTGRFLGGKDGDGMTYDASYAVFGIRPGSRNRKYMSSSLYFCPTSPSNVAILRRWAECSTQAVYNGQGPFPGYGDEDLLNSLIFIMKGPGGIELLENATWSQHWRYWDDVIVHDQGVFRNTTFGGKRQRSLHCPAGEKFWERRYRDRVATTNPAQAVNYAWWLYLFWFGRCQDRSSDPAALFPGTFRHLRRDVVRYFEQIRQFDPAVTLEELPPLSSLRRKSGEKPATANAVKRRRLAPKHAGSKPGQKG